MNQTPKTTHRKQPTEADQTKPSPSLNQRSGRSNCYTHQLNRQAYVGTTIKKGPKTK